MRDGLRGQKGMGQGKELSKSIPQGRISVVLPELQNRNGIEKGNRLECFLYDHIAEYQHVDIAS